MDNNINSIRVILDLYKNNSISIDEAIQLIEDLYKNKWYYIPYMPPIVTYETQKNIPDYKVTC
jgi:hypothetical protein